MVANLDKKYMKTKLKNLILEINLIDGNSIELEKYLQEYLDLSPNNSITKIKDFDNIYRNFEKKYKNYINLYNIFKDIYIKAISHHLNLEDKNNIINNIEKLKNDELFSSGECIKFINFVYVTIYECMKLEKLIYKDTTIYNYITNNPHDFWYINLLIKNEIEELTTSINYIPGVKELKEIINENLVDDVYLNIKIIEAIIRCNYIDESLTNSFEEYYKIYDKLEEIHSEIQKERKNTYTGLLAPCVAKDLEKELNKIKTLGLEFIKEQGFLFFENYQMEIVALQFKMQNVQEQLEYWIPTKKRKKIKI